MHGAQVGAALERLIAFLPEKLRQPLILSTIEEMSPREVAATLGIGEAAVRSRVFRARQILREKLEQHMGRKQRYRVKTCADENQNRNRQASEPDALGHEVERGSGQIRRGRTASRTRGTSPRPSANRARAPSGSCHGGAGAGARPVTLVAVIRVVCGSWHGRWERGTLPACEPSLGDPAERATT